MFHLRWLQARPLPTCFDTVLMVQKAEKFQSRIVFVWLTGLHLSSEITATCSEMVICSIFGSKMYTSFERSYNFANTDLTCGFNCLGHSTLQATFCCLYVSLEMFSFNQEYSQFIEKRYNLLRRGAS